jgi:uncharacterized protein (DUF427 family)
MSLTIGTGPFAGHPGGVFNFELVAPPHRIFFEDYPRRVRGVFGGETIVDSVGAKLLHETGILPVLYFPEQDLADDLFSPTAHQTHCQFKGDASYWTIEAGGRVAENAVWGYPDPLAPAPWLAGYRAFYWDRVDSWMEEDEELDVPHLRDPYHRVEVRRGSDRVTVLAGGEAIAQTTKPMLLFETSLPVRWYIPREDIDSERLSASATTSRCPYKGTAEYWSVQGSDGLIEDAGWAYRDPRREAEGIADCICFLAEGIEVRVERAGRTATVPTG